MQLTDLCIFTEPQQGATYGMLLTLAQRAELLGFGGFFRSDHFLSMGGVSGLPGPTDASRWVDWPARDDHQARHVGDAGDVPPLPRPSALRRSTDERRRIGSASAPVGMSRAHRAWPTFRRASTFGDPEDQLAIIEGM